MANNLKARPMDAIVQEFASKGFGPATIRFMQDLAERNDKALTNLGEVQSLAPVKGRTEGIGTTVSQHDDTGKLISTDAIAADGTGSPLTGGKRGFQALNTQNQLSSSFHSNAVNVSNTPTGATSLANDGVSTVISVASGQNRFAPSNVSYNSGSVDPGVFGGPYFVYALDPQFLGGAVTYIFTLSPVDLTSNEGVTFFGSITTVSGSSKTGGGNTGGSGGGRGGRGYEIA